MFEYILVLIHYFCNNKTSGIELGGIFSFSIVSDHHSFGCCAVPKVKILMLDIWSSM